jgi:hypothetical protein
MKKNKTRKNKQKGGIIAKIPINSNTNINDFSNKWNIFYIASHGSLNPNIKFIIPNDTYILYIAPSGQSCGKDDSILNQIVYNDNSASEIISKNKFWRNFYNFITLKNTNATGFKSTFYNDTLPKNYNDITTVGFYEPGDECHELYLSFLTEPPLYFFETGLYKLPMKKSYMDYVETVQEEISDKYINKESINEIKKSYNRGNKFFHSRTDNLLVNELKNNITSFKLSDILNMPSTYEINKKRIFIIFSCRNISSGNISNTLKVRRHSINLRKYK